MNEEQARAGTFQAQLDEFRIRRAALAIALFGQFRWYRQHVRGGHWEYWYVNDGMNRMWLPTLTCSMFVGAKRPHGGCLGTPVCEDWPAR